MTHSVKMVLGFDYGQKRLGVAVGNVLTVSAQPIKIIPVQQGIPDWKIIDSLIAEWHPDALIVGMPFTADGLETQHTHKIRQFIAILEARYSMPVFIVDEHLSSIESLAYVKATPKAQKTQLDAIAAAVIVETWLNDQSSR